MNNFDILLRNVSNDIYSEGEKLYKDGKVTKEVITKHNSCFSFKEKERKIYCNLTFSSEGKLVNHYCDCGSTRLCKHLVAGLLVLKNNDISDEKEVDMDIVRNAIFRTNLYLKYQNQFYLSLYDLFLKYSKESIINCLVTIYESDYFEMSNYLVNLFYFFNVEFKSIKKADYMRIFSKKIINNMLNDYNHIDSNKLSILGKVLNLYLSLWRQFVEELSNYLAVNINKNLLNVDKWLFYFYKSPNEKELPFFTNNYITTLYKNNFFKTISSSSFLETYLNSCVILNKNLDEYESYLNFEFENVSTRISFLKNIFTITSSHEEFDLLNLKIYKFIASNYPNMFLEFIDSTKVKCLNLYKRICKYFDNPISKFLFSPLKEFEKEILETTNFIKFNQLILLNKQGFDFKNNLDFLQKVSIEDIDKSINNSESNIIDVLNFLTESNIILHKEDFLMTFITKTKLDKYFLSNIGNSYVISFINHYNLYKNLGFTSMMEGH